MKKIILTTIICFLTISIAFTQTNLSVSLDDPAYDILEYIQIRNYTKRLHTSKPYTLDLILDTLYESLTHENMSLTEKEIINGTIDRLTPKKTTEFKEDASFWQNLGTLGSVGHYRYESTESGIPVSAEIGASVQLDLVSNFNEPSVSTDNWVNVYVMGDISEYFSYNFSAGAGIMKLDLSAYKAYSFYQSWLGYQYLLADPDNYTYVGGKSEEFAAGIQIYPEFRAAFFDNKIGINFSRGQRDWGTGSGNLMLSETAQPFTALEMYLRPVDFISLSSLTGVLEYYRETSIKGDAENFQNAFTAFMGEVFIGDYGYASLLSSAVWPKRFEPGYIIPGMIPFINQNLIGDYDNVQMGIGLGINIPQYASFYYNVFIDELNFTVDDFFHKDRNMYSYQTGLDVVIPNTPLVTFSFQYTKIEPYMYTHPGAYTPWYDENLLMEMNYVNHGESLGYYLPPNSDELKITGTAMPFWFLQTNLSYSLIRHGLDVDGSSLDDHHIYDTNDPDYEPLNEKTKYFLTDGTYEWIHSIGANAELDLRFVKDIPLSLSLGYTLSFTHHTEPDTLNKSFKPVNNSEYKDTWGNYLTLSVKVW